MTINIGESIVPVDFDATGDLAKAILTWTEVSGITYDVYRSSDANCDVLTHFNSSSSCTDGQLYNSATTGMEDTGLAAETTYYYWIQATRSSDSTTQASLTPISATTIAMGVLNDTGMYYAGNYADTSSSTHSVSDDCSSNINADDAHQDCHFGRDVTHNYSSDGKYGFSFTKLDSDGNDLAASANSWSCVRDNVTGLVWEVKATSGDRDKDTEYNWGGLTAIGRDHDSREGEYYDDWSALVDAANAENVTGLCGFTDWRVPNFQELFSIVYLGRTQSDFGKEPPLDTDYFPNAYNDSGNALGSYWTAAPISDDADYALYINFINYSVGGKLRSGLAHVRLVRSE